MTDDKMVLRSWWLEQLKEHKSNKEIEEFFNLALKEIDLKEHIIKSWKRYYFGGFDSFSDYEKYGDMFLPIEKK